MIEMKLKKKWLIGKSYRSYGKKKPSNSGGTNVGGRKARCRARAPR